MKMKQSKLRFLYAHYHFKYCWHSKRKKKEDLLGLEVTNYSSHALLWQIMACFKVTFFFPALR